MLRLYYTIWMDCIRRARTQRDKEPDWRFLTMLHMTIAMVANFILVMTLLEKFVLKDYFYKIEFSNLPQKFNLLLSEVILFVAPCILINWLLIFRKQRYRQLIKRYRYYNGKLFISYFVASLALPVILLWVGIIYTRF